LGEWDGRAALGLKWRYFWAFWGFLGVEERQYGRTLWCRWLVVKERCYWSANGYRWCWGAGNGMDFCSFDIT